MGSGVCGVFVSWSYFITVSTSIFTHHVYIGYIPGTEDYQVKTRILYVLYGIVLILLAVFSWGFVDMNLPFQAPLWLYNLVYHERGAATIIYGGFVFVLFVFYLFVLRQIKKNSWGIRNVWLMLIISVMILFFSFPAFSFDVFNYIATAKVTFFYRENPYLVMPIDIPNEPSLSYLHAANKVALYGPVWILLTSIPHALGLGSILLSIFTFKALVVVFYMLLVRLIWKMTKSAYSTAFFGLNPLVLMETVLGGHNDVVMMYLALLSFYLLQKNKSFWSLVILTLSIFIKGATVMLTPLFLWVLWKKQKRKKIIWDKVWFWAAMAMYTIFFLSPIREEIYAWYLIWPLAFAALLPGNLLLQYITIGFSFGLLFRIAPFLYTRQWGGITPTVKRIVTFLPPALFTLYYAVKKKI